MRIFTQKPGTHPAWLLAATICLLGGFGQKTVQAIEIHVPADQATIAEALAVASAQDTVLVASGTYSSVDLELPDQVTLRGESGDPADVLLDAGNSGSVLICTDLNAGTRIQAVTLTHANDTALRCTNSSLLLENCIISDSSGHDGGGLYILGPAAPVISGCRFLDNTTTYSGGGINCGDSPLPDLPQITDCLFARNTSSGGGGAANLQSQAGTSFSGCSFLENSSYHNGGALRSDYNPCTLVSCLLYANKTIYSEDSCFYGNELSSLQLSHCTLVYNKKDLLRLPPENVSIDHTIIAFSDAPIFAEEGTVASITCSDVFGNAAGDWVGPLAGQEGVDGNLAADPLFCGPRSWDFHLTENSPCLAGGTCGTIGALDSGCPTTGNHHQWLVPAEVPTIAAALDSAWAGDEIILAAGLYLENSLYLASGVSIRGETGDPTDTIIDAGGSYQHFRHNGITGTVLSGLTLQGSRSYVIAPSSYPAEQVVMENCIITGNTCFYSTYELIRDVDVLRNCTIAFNDLGAIEAGPNTVIENCLIAYNKGQAVAGTPQAITCSNFFANQNGDWIHALGEFAGTDGNLSQEPRFCDPVAGDLALAADSPCLGGACGLIGALGQGCSSAVPFPKRHVPADYPTIAEALAAASFGDSVIVAAGTYYETNLSVPAGIVLTGATGDPADVVIDGQGQSQVLYCDLSHGSRIESLSIVNGISGGSAGGASCNAYNLAFNNCIFTGNRGDSGAISFRKELFLRNCTLARNQGYWLSGGVTANYGATVLDLDRTIIACNEDGPALDIDQPDNVAVWISNCDFSENAGGNWPDYLPTGPGTGGNIEQYPEFCDLGGGDFGLASGSPCLFPASAADMGAFTAGCAEKTPCREWLVPAEMPTIQSALDTAAPFDTVTVSPGTYTWSGEGSSGEAMLDLASGVFLRSQTGLADCVTLDAQGQGLVFRASEASGVTTLRGFTLTGGTSPEGGAASSGGGYCTNSDINLQNTVFTGNSDCDLSMFSSGVKLTDCEFRDPIGPHGAIISLTEGSAYYGFVHRRGPDFLRCVFHGYTGAGYTPVVSSQGWFNGFQNCLFYSNQEEAVIDIYLWPDLTWFYIRNTIFAENRGVALSADNYQYLYPSNITCNDIYGMAGDLNDFLGSGGNVATDPAFIDPAGGDFHLSWESLLWESECGLIGPFGLGEGGFAISSITDISPDQGGQVRVRWNRAYHDDPETDQGVISYGLWRRVDDGSKGMPRDEMAKFLPGHEPPPGEWDCVATVPAWGRDGYSYVSPTLCDSTISQGQCWTVFFITAHSDDPARFWVTEPDSGYSTDDLAPAAPAGFAVAYGPDNALSWNAVDAQDLCYYRIYRGETPDFEPDPDQPLHQTAETSWLDPDGDSGSYYLVAAVDFAGNSSDPVAPTAVSGVDTAPPARFALRQNTPNPFNPATTIHFDLPEPGTVKLAVYDTAGRLVKSLVLNDYLQAGRHDVRWDGTDSQGRQAASGVYFYRLIAGADQAVGRMALVK